MPPILYMYCTESTPLQYLVPGSGRQRTTGHYFVSRTTEGISANIASQTSSQSLNTALYSGLATTARPESLLVLTAAHDFRHHTHLAPTHHQPARPHFIAFSHPSHHHRHKDNHCGRLLPPDTSLDASKHVTQAASPTPMQHRTNNRCMLRQNREPPLAPSVLLVRWPWPQW